MTIMVAQKIRDYALANKRFIEPFEPQSKQFQGMSYGLSACGYDIRLGGNGSFIVHPGTMILGVSLERMAIPTWMCGIVHDKSTLARIGLAVQNTVLEPGWEGWITLEISNHGSESKRLFAGQPIAQVLFHSLGVSTDMPYKGKYQNQPNHPVEAIYDAEGDK